MPSKSLPNASKKVKAAPPIDFHLRDVGGVSKGDVVLRPGMNIFRGPNGSGKTSTINAIAAVCGADVPLEVRDGATEGYVSGNGVSLTIRKVAAKTGAAEVEVVGGDDLAELIDGGGYADPKARAKARVRALLRIERLPVTEETISALAAGETEVAEQAMQECRDNLIDDLLDAAEKVRRIAHSHAKISEDAQAQALAAGDVQEAQAREAVASIGGEEALLEIPAEDARANAQTLRDRLAVARAEATKRRDLEALQAEIRETLGQRPDVAQFSEKYTRAQDAREARECELEALQEKAAEIAAAIAEKRVAVVEAKELQQRIGRRIAETQTATEEWDRRAGVLGRPVEGPLQAEVEALEASSRQADETANRAAVSASYRAGRDAAAAVRRQAADHATRAEFLRTVATTVQDRLGKLLNGTDVEGLTVNAEGRLCVMDGGKLYDFEKRRSEGQQISAALRHVARRSAGRLVPLEGKFFRAMQPKMQQELAAQALSLGIVLVTEAPSDTEGITIQHFPAQDAAMAQAVAS